MENKELEKVIQKAKIADKVVIVAASRCGRELIELLEEENVRVDVFFDNDEKKEGTLIRGIQVVKPYKLAGENILYIVAIDSIKGQEELKKQLLSLGISEEHITRSYCEKDDEYYSSLDEEFYKEEISKQYKGLFERELNWNNPTTYTEIINWEKINIRDKRRTEYADKVMVREHIKKKIGEKYLTKQYGVWDNAEDIDFDALPSSFVLKLNHGSGMNIVVKDKEKVDFEEIKKQLNEWKKMNYAFFHGQYELHYKDIVPKISCDEYLEGVADNVYDYNIYCFHGEPEYIWCIKGSHKPECKASFYNKDWEMQEFSFGYPKDEELAPKPENLDEMIRLSRILSEEFTHVRVDWYNLPDGRLLFGELTFATWGGLKHFKPEKYDQVFGKLVLGNDGKYEWK